MKQNKRFLTDEELQLLKSLASMGFGCEEDTEPQRSILNSLCHQILNAKSIYITKECTN